MFANEAVNATDQLLQLIVSAPENRKLGAIAVLQGHAVAVDPSSQSRPYEPLLSLAEVGKRVGFSRETLRRWKVPGVVLGNGSVRYRASEVFDYIETHEFGRRAMALRAERQLSPQTVNTTTQT